eukprot:403903_1
MQKSVLILAFATIHFGIVIGLFRHCIESDQDFKTQLEDGSIDYAKIRLRWAGVGFWLDRKIAVSGTETVDDCSLSEEEYNYNMAVSRYYQYDSNAHRMKVIDGSEQDLLVSKYVFYILVSYGLGTTVLVMVLAYKLRQMSKMKKALKHGHQNVPIHEMDVDSNCGITKQ